MRRARDRERRQGRSAREDRGVDGGDRQGGTVGFHRHCEEHLRRSNPDCRCGEILDCFAALAMTVERGAIAPHLQVSSLRTQGPITPGRGLAKIGYRPVLLPPGPR
ncbi:hypothetical protein GPL20_22495 [Bradyrhizobium cajani]|uniref:Uncharacterized protein n=1 Tax=Bradyrhizobium cajani TaxID=1928661 RepID=A0A844TGN5_9BRAD|nr:hypothetical protein [Bradyrhizobium cajani]